MSTMGNETLEQDSNVFFFTIIRATGVHGEGSKKGVEVWKNEFVKRNQ